ncbi:hypothetical protein Tco_0965650 [Tanacetum coccineum]
MRNGGWGLAKILPRRLIERCEFSSASRPEDMEIRPARHQSPLGAPSTTIERSSYDLWIKSPSDQATTEPSLLPSDRQPLELHDAQDATSLWLPIKEDLECMSIEYEVASTSIHQVLLICLLKSKAILLDKVLLMKSEIITKLGKMHRLHQASCKNTHSSYQLNKSFVLSMPTTSSLETHDDDDLLHELQMKL